MTTTTNAVTIISNGVCILPGLNELVDAARGKNHDYVNLRIRELCLNGQFQSAIEVTELLATLDLENSYCRLCRAGLYLKFDMQEKLAELKPLLSEPRGYHQASDIHELSHQVDKADDGPMKAQLFEPLKRVLDDEAFERDKLASLQLK